MNGAPRERPLGSQYVLGGAIGAGVTGKVYRGRSRVTGQEYAIKVLNVVFVDDPSIVTRFMHERELLQAVRHPRVVKVEDLVFDAGQLAIVMELVDGGDLARGFEKPCTLRQGVEVATQIADALQAIHAAGLVHLNLKPANVLYERTSHRMHVRVSDFGVSRLVAGPLAQITSLVGTPSYLAPEVSRGEQVTGAADIYGLGAVLYELLTGRPPFVADNPHALIRAHDNDPVPRPGDMPEPVWQGLEAMLAKDARQRPTAVEAARWLGQLAPWLAGHAPRYRLGGTAAGTYQQRTTGIPAGTRQQFETGTARPLPPSEPARSPDGERQVSTVFGPVDVMAPQDGRRSAAHRARALVLSGLLVLSCAIGAWFLFRDADAWFLAREDTTTQPTASPGQAAKVLRAPASTAGASVLAESVESDSEASSTSTEELARGRGAPDPAKDLPAESQPDSQPAAQAPEEIPDLRSSDTWTLVVESLEQDVYSLEAARQRAARYAASDIMVLDSSNTAGLRPGYWAITYGEFASTAEASASCADLSLSPGGQCYPRYLE